MALYRWVCRCVGRLREDGRATEDDAFVTHEVVTKSRAQYSQI